MPGFGGSGERLQRAEGVAPFWVWGKLATGIEPKTPSSRKLSHVAIWEAKASSGLLGTQGYSLHSQG